MIELGARRYLLRDPVSEVDTADGCAVRREARAQEIGPMRRLAWLRAVRAKNEVDGSSMLAAALAEAQLLADMQALPGVPQLIDIDSAPTQVTVAYSLPGQSTFAETYGSFNGQPLEQAEAASALRAVEPLCLALAELHRRGHSHRALTADAILVDWHRRAVLRDLGLATTPPVGGEGPDTYRAPEQCAVSVSDSDPGPHTDIYRLAALLYHTLTGQDPTDMGSALPHSALSDELHALLKRALAPVPRERPASISEFSRGLRRAVRQMSAGGTTATRSRTVQLPGPLALVPSESLRQKLASERARHPYLPDFDAMVRQLNELHADGVPARVEATRGQHRLLVYGPNWVAALFPTRFDDAYLIAALMPLGVRDHDRLANGAVWLRPAQWLLFADLRSLKHDRFQSYWAEISSAWSDLLSEPATATAGLFAHHASSLELLDQVIEADKAIELARHRAAPSMPYSNVSLAASKERNSASEAYVFTMVNSNSVKQGTKVIISGDWNMYGTIVRVSNAEIAVRFDRNIEFQKIPIQGRLDPIAEDSAYRWKAATMDRIRSGKSIHAGLLRALGNRAFAGYSPDQALQPSCELSSEQMDALSRALAIPDMLLIQAPPGTGKVTLISEIVRASAMRGHRVLVAANTNIAVDHILDRMPGEIRSVRIGSEQSVISQAAAERLVDAQIVQLQEAVKRGTHASADSLADFLARREEVDRWMAHLQTEVNNAIEANRHVEQFSTALDAAASKSAPTVRQRLRQLEHAIADEKSVTERRQAAVSIADQRYERSLARRPTGLFAPILRWLRGRRLRQCDAAARALAAHESWLKRARQDRDKIAAELRQLIESDPEVRRLDTDRTAAITRRDTALAEVDQSASLIQHAIAGLTQVPRTDTSGLASRIQFQRWAQEMLTTLTWRAALLSEWRTHTANSPETLAGELTRYADVVGVTCNRMMTSGLLSDIDFDLAIIDEASQISLPDMLGPLAQSKRVVLVGDHSLSPLFVDRDVVQWVQKLQDMRSDGAEADTSRQLRDLMTTSIFERLFTTAPATNRVTLSRQFRMPEPVASFVSQQFYNGGLHTVIQETSRHLPIFRSSFALIDTADQPVAQRAEHLSISDGKGNGFINSLEARLIGELVKRSIAYTSDNWSVIVPYRAQQAEITRVLVEMLGDSSAVAANVGTIESFQGQERDLVIFGFTRSNRSGNVGFLQDTRRINTAITRARSQLIVVGDFDTLAHARDDQFAGFVRAMFSFVKAHGEIRLSRTVLDGEGEK
jgi:hypothetical protein